MAKIGVIGKRNAVLYYMSVGYSVYEADGAEESKIAFQRAVDDGSAVIFITEDVAGYLTEELDKSRKAVTPAVSVIPSGNGGRESFGVKLMKDAVERAVGADIIFRE